jgi:hypothetical protein
MIITESFVWINNPKTASTFVRNVLSELYRHRGKSLQARWRLRKRKFRELLVPERRPSSGARFGKPTPHGTVKQIPKQFSQLPVVSAIRHPVARYASLYYYADWKKVDQLPVQLEIIRKVFPNFPDLSIREFFEYTIKFYGNNTLVVGQSAFDIGPMSADFLRFFSSESGDEENKFIFESWESLTEQLRRITFLNSSKINQELFTFLLMLEFDPKDIVFLKNKAPDNVSEKSKTTDLSDPFRELVRNTEWLLDYAANQTTPLDWSALKYAVKS